MKMYATLLDNTSQNVFMKIGTFM